MFFNAAYLRFAILILPCTAIPQLAVAQPAQFSKKVLTERYYCDGITAADINGDRHIDIVAGPFWYAGPDFTDAHEIYEPVPLVPEDSPSNSMFSFVHDFNHDGRPDVLVLGRVHKHQAKWYENPGNTEDLWASHFVFERVKGESPALVDLNSDGIPELITHHEGRWGFLQPDVQSPTRPWNFFAIGEPEEWNEFYHGQGVGDLNEDGRLDVIINDGWYEQPVDTTSGPWTFHRKRFSTERGGAQMFAYDVNADGAADVISAVSAHEWGLAWYQRQAGNVDEPFRERLIMGDRTREAEFGAAFTQPHALAHADINGDGLPDIVTGKRMWAHGPKGDIEPNAAPVVFWFELIRNNDGSVRYLPHQIDDASGVGVQIAAVDVNSDGRVDVLTASKLGCFLFLNKTDR